VSVWKKPARSRWVVTPASAAPATSTTIPMDASTIETTAGARDRDRPTGGGTGTSGVRVVGWGVWVMVMLAMCTASLISR